MKGFYCRIGLWVLLFASVWRMSLWSGTTGKIAGTVVDKTTNAPLPGANVVIMGTELGAVTDVNGQFTILYVPPGVYDVQISFLGYAKTTIKDVQVNIDQTAKVSVALQQEVIEGQMVTVVAQRTRIKEDVATSTVAISDREVQQLPVANVASVVGLQAGIQGMSIRGGLAEEALFMLDGITMRDPRNNQPVNRVALSAIKEISIERGGFNAEYGQVQSGLINVVTREGSKEGYFGTLMTRIAPPQPKYYRGHGIPDVHDPDSYWMRPYVDDAVCWTGTRSGAWDAYTQSKYPDFEGWNAVSEKLLTDSDPNNDLTPLAAQRVFFYKTRKEQPNDLADYEIDGGVGGPVPLISKPLGGLRFFTSYRRQREVLLWPQTRPDYLDYDWMGQLISDITPSIKLRFTGTLGKQFTLVDNWNTNFFPRSPRDIAGGTGGNVMFNMFSNWAYCNADIGHRSLATKWTHTLNPKTFYEVSLEFFQRKYDFHPIALRDTSKKYEIVPGYYRDETPFGYWPSATSDGIVFEMGEQASLARDSSLVSRTTLKVDFTSQANFNNLVKAGVEFEYNDLDFNYGRIQMQTEGKAYANHVVMRVFPIRASAYIQDKLETREFTMNVGLRLDYSHSRTDWWDNEIDPYDPFFISSKYNPNREFPMKKSKAQWQLSPRLGISHPISENTKLFFNYGHFKQIPSYETLFRIDRNMQNQLQNLGDPNLILAKTIEYELGLDHILFTDYLIQLSAFYRDITDQQTTTRYISISGDAYNLTTSNVYRDIRGFELTLRKTAGRWFSGFANYTYQVTSYGNFGPAQRYQDPSAQKRYNENTVNLYQQRPVPAPYARANVSFYTPRDFGPKIFGAHVLGDWLVNLLLNWSDGGKTTYNPKNVAGITNNVEVVDYFDGTLRISKGISFKKAQVQLFMDVTNLFNQLRLTNTYDQAYRISLHLPKSKAYNNIPGHDKIGDYRKPGVEWQPMEYRAEVDRTQPAGSERVIYYEGSTGKYWQYSNGTWNEVEKARLKKILDTKAYINMPGPSTYWFLNPRAYLFGIRVSFNLE